MVYDARPVPTDIEIQLRRLILALFTIGLAGVGTELIALGHYEDSWQLVPLVIIAILLGIVTWQATSGSAESVRVLQIFALLMILVGVLGVVFHYRGNMEFQLEMNPDAGGWELFRKILHAKAPPALAPGVMAQLGLLGLIYSFRHPALRGRQ